MAVQETKVPQLRFKEFNDVWNKKELKSLKIKVIDGDRGKNYPNGNDFSLRGYCLFLNAKNVTKKGFSFSINSFITEEKDKILSKGKLNLNDIVLTTRGSVGHIAFYDEDIPYKNLRINSGMVIIRGNNTIIDYTYLYKYFNSNQIQNEIKKISFGSAQPQLTVKEINKFKITYPSIPEQQKIATFLTAVDKKITLLQQKKTALEQYKKGVMQQLFSQHLRFKPALSGAEGDDDGNAYSDWEEKRLGEVCEINPKAKKLPNSFVYVDLESVTKGVLTKEERIYKNDSPSRAQRLLKYKDILFQTVRPYQMNNLYFKIQHLDYVASTGYAQIRANESSAYLYHYLHTYNFVKKVLLRCTGTSYPAINSNDLGKISIKIPSIEEQTKIANYLSAIDAKIALVDKQLSQTQVFKKGLLQQLFV